MHPGIVAALRMEGRCLAAQARPGKVRDIGDGRLLFVSGIGAGNARKAANALLQAGVDALISWGFAGAVSADVHVGDLLLPMHVVDTKGRQFGVCEAWRRRLQEKLTSENQSIHAGAIAETGTVVRTSDERRSFRPGCLAVDMESATIAAVAEAANLPFLVIRAVSDGCDEQIPESVLCAVNDYGDLRPRAFASLMAKPQHWPALWRLRRDAHLAMRTLSQAARYLKPELWEGKTAREIKAVQSRA